MKHEIPSHVPCIDLIRKPTSDAITRILNMQDVKGSNRGIYNFWSVQQQCMRTGKTKEVNKNGR